MAHSYYDRQFNNWLHKYTYKKNYPDKVGQTLRYCYENGRITNYEELMEEIKDALVAEGFVLSVANTDTTGGESGKSNRYVCFVKGDIEIVIENNYTKYFWIYFYVTGDWTLNRNK